MEPIPLPQWTVPNIFFILCRFFNACCQVVVVGTITLKQTRAVQSKQLVPLHWSYCFLFVDDKSY